MRDRVAMTLPPDSDGERIRESERRRIAKDLHDDLGSHLTAIKMALAQLSRQLPASKNSSLLRKQSDLTDHLIDDAIDAMHNIIDDLHPPVLDLGLYAGLEWLALSFSRQTGIPHHLLAGDDPSQALLDDFQTISLYRIARESLHNAARHAAASKVDLRLYLDRSKLKLKISDDGVGLPDQAGTLPDTAGLRNMRARAASIDAVLTVSSAAGGGTCVSVELPVRSDANPIK